MKVAFSVALATVFVGLAGCGNSNSTAPPSQVGAAASNVPEKEVGLELHSIKDVPTQLAARKGKVVVLDMWATW